MGTLRDEQKQLVRSRILDAVAEEVAVGGLVDLAVPAVAERAGVSIRTVYNYFPTKDDLLASLAEEIDAWLLERGGPTVETEFDRIVEAARVNFGLFSDLGTRGAAMARIRAERRLADRNAPPHPQTAERTAAFRDAVAALRPDLDDEQVWAVTAMLRAIVGLEMWDRLAHDFRLDGDQGGRVAAWALAVLVDALESGRGPFDD